MKASQIRTFLITFAFVTAQASSAFAADTVAIPSDEKTHSIDQKEKESINSENQTPTTNTDTAALAKKYGISEEQLAQMTPEQIAQLAAEKKKKGSAMMFLGIGAAAGLGALMFMSSKSGSTPKTSSASSSGGSSGGSASPSVYTSSAPAPEADPLNSYAAELPATTTESPATSETALGAVTALGAGGDAAGIGESKATPTPTPAPSAQPEAKKATADTKEAAADLVTPQTKAADVPAPAEKPKKADPVSTIKDHSGEQAQEKESTKSDDGDMSSWKVPVDQFKISSCIGSDRGGGRSHGGIDLAKPSGTPIKAVAGGVVEKAGWLDDHCGNGVKIRHPNGMATIYCHMKDKSIAVKMKGRVSQGTVIGQVGSTGTSSGPHLHFAMKKANNAVVNPLDYMPQILDHASVNAAGCKPTGGSKSSKKKSAGKK